MPNGHCDLEKGARKLVFRVTRGSRLTASIPDRVMRFWEVEGGATQPSQTEGQKARTVSWWGWMKVYFALLRQRNENKWKCNCELHVSNTSMRIVFMKLVSRGARCSFSEREAEALANQEANFAKSLSNHYSWLLNGSSWKINELSISFSH